MVIGTTNRLKYIDPSLLRAGRFDKHYYIAPPDLKARGIIWRIHAKTMIQNGVIDQGVLNEFAMYELTGAQIQSAVTSAVLFAR